MTTTIKVHVNGRYRTTVKRFNADGTPVSETVIEGNYEGSPNMSGEHSFYLGHPASGSFEISEEYLGEPKLVQSAQPGDAGVSDGD